MIILLAITDSSHQLGSFDQIAKRFPHVARQASMQVMDADSQLLVGKSHDSYTLTKIGMWRLVEPQVIDELPVVLSRIKNHKYGATIVMGCGRTYRTFLPFADRIVHIELEGVFPDVFNGASDDIYGTFLDLSQNKYRTAWGEGEARTYGLQSPGQPEFIQIDYTSTGKAHFELEQPPGSVSDRGAPQCDLLGINDESKGVWTADVFTGIAQNT